MKILIATSTLSFGGAERTAANLSIALSQNHEVDVLTFHGNVTYPYRGQLIDLNLPYEPEAGLVKKFWKFYKKVTGFRRISKRYDPDIILSVTEGPNLIALFNKILGLKAKVIINIQSPPKETYKGLNKIIYTWMIRKLYRRADLVIPLSKGVACELMEYFYIPAEKIQVVNNPIDIDQIFSVREDPVEQDIFQPGYPAILTVGRLVSQKNHALLINAFARVLKNYKAHLVIIGNGPLENELRRLTDRLGIQGEVYFLGWQPNPYQYMYHADIFVLPSDYEGFGNVIVEAMACGCPVISSNCQYGPGEILDGGKYGILLPPGDENAFVDAINYLLANPTYRSELSVSGELRANDFSLPRIAKQYEELIQALN